MTCGLYLIYNDNEPKQAPLEHLSMEVHVSQTTATISLNQIYKNESDSSLEAIYGFPIHPDAAINNLIIKIEDKVVQAVVKEKEEAKREYDDNVKKGNSAFLLERSIHSSMVHQLKVGRLPAKKSCQILIEFSMEIKMMGMNQCSLIIPTSIAPRYGGATVPNYDGTADFKLNGTLDQYIRHVECSSHPKIKVGFVDNNITACGNIEFEKDIVFHFELQESKECGVSVALSCGPDVSNGKRLYGAAISLLTNIAQPTNEFDVEQEYIFMIDCSGSMNGEKIKNTVSALKIFFRSLKKGCFVNFICFGSEYRVLFPSGSVPYDNHSFEQIRQFINQVDSNMGGTELFPCLEFILKKMPRNPSAPQKTSLFLLTDGEVWDTDKVISLCNKSNARIFGIGIGNECSHELLDGAASATGGKTEYITDASRIEQVVIRQLKRSFQTFFSNVSVNWEGIDWETKAPAKIPAIFNGDKCVIYYLFTANKENLSGKVSFLLTDSKGRNQHLTYSFDTKDITDSKSIYSIACHKVIKEREEIFLSLTEDDPVRENLKQEIILYSKSSGVLSRFTSFIAVHNRENVDPNEPLQTTIVGAKSAMMCEDIDFYDDACDDLILESAAMPIASMCIPFSANGSMFKSSCLGVGTPEISRENNSTNDKLVNIIDLQNYDGSWSLTEELVELLNIDNFQEKLETLRQVTQSMQVGNIEVSIFVLAVISAVFIDRVDAWELIYQKAWEFVQNNVPNKNPVDFVSIAKHILYQPKIDKID